LVSVPDGQGGVHKFKEENTFAYAQPEFFEILDIPLLRGDFFSALREPNTAVLTQRTAQKYFGEADPIGKTFRVENTVDFRVTGILKDLPENTDRREEVYCSYASLKSHLLGGPTLDHWNGVNSSTHCFALLPPGKTAAELEQALPAFADKYIKDNNGGMVFRVLPMREMHFSARYGEGVEKKFLWALALIGVFLLATACVNFINMATAQALSRAKEVGIRKSLGSTRGQLFWQFMGETGAIVVMAAAVGLVLARLALPSYNEWTESTLALHIDATLLGFILLLAAVVIFLAGAYPGLVQARFDAAQSLKGELGGKQAGGFSLRRVLVGLQFTISQMLIICAVVITAQVNFAKQADLGFNKDALVVVPVPLQDKVKISTLRQQLSTVPGVEMTSFCYQTPAANSNNTTNLTFETREKPENWYINTKPADEYYLAAFGLKLVAGRNLQPSDTVREYVVNEQTVKKLGLASPQDVLGKSLDVWGIRAPVVGVVKDFHNYSFANAIDPVCFMSHRPSYSSCAIKVNLQNLPATLVAIDKTWNGVFPEHYYEYTFFDERVAEFYKKESVMLNLIRSFAGIAIFIGCLGLFGLVTYMAARKTKEIGIRKTLGASTGSILLIFSKEFVRLILIAFAVAAPVAWWAMNAWLEDYEYRVSIGWSVFLTALATTFAIAAVTVGYRSLRSALANPVTSLRSE
jgi:putative ABC transport system permease protein